MGNFSPADRHNRYPTLNSCVTAFRYTLPESAKSSDLFWLSVNWQSQSFYWRFLKSGYLIVKLQAFFAHELTRESLYCCLQGVQDHASVRQVLEHVRLDGTYVCVRCWYVCMCALLVRMYVCIDGMYICVHCWYVYMCALMVRIYVCIVGTYICVHWWCVDDMWMYVCVCVRLWYIYVCALMVCARMFGSWYARSLRVDGTCMCVKKGRYVHNCAGLLSTFVSFVWTLNVNSTPTRTNKIHFFFTHVCVYTLRVCAYTQGICFFGGWVYPYYKIACMRATYCDNLLILYSEFFSSG